MEKIINDANIDEILASPLPVVIDFWATWCGPCRMLAPTVEDIAAEYEGRAIVAKCNVDDCEELADRFGIRNIPTLIYCKGGQVVNRSAGLVSKKDIAAVLDSLI